MTNGDLRKFEEFIEGTGKTMYRGPDWFVNEVQKRAYQWDAMIHAPRRWWERLWSKIHRQSWRRYAKRRFDKACWFTPEKKP